MNAPNYLSLAIHGAFKPGIPCLVSGFVMNGNDQPISPVFQAWATFTPVSDPPRARGRKENHAKKIAVRMADLCWRGTGQLQGVKADQKLCEYFGYADPRHAKKDISKAKRLLPPKSFLLTGSGESSETGERHSMAFVFEEFPAVCREGPGTLSMSGAGYSWIEPDREASHNPTLTLRLTTATRIEMESFTVTLADMARIPVKPPNSCHGKNSLKLA